MNGRVAIEVYSGRFVELIDLDEATSGSVELTSVFLDQQRALVRLFLFRSHKRQHIGDIDVSPILHEPPTLPRIAVSADFDQKRQILRVSVLLDRQVYAHSELLLRHQPLRRQRARWAPAAALGLAALGVAAALLLFVGPGKLLTLGRAPGNPQASPASEAAGAGSAGTVRQAPAAAAAPEAALDAAPKTPRVPAAQDRGGAEAAQYVVYFRADSAGLLPETRQRLDALLPILESQPDTSVTISGHCANFGDRANRLELSELRARSVYDYLLRSGWKPRVSPKLIGHGSEQPITVEPDQQQLNRRVVVELSPSR